MPAERTPLQYPSQTAWVHPHAQRALTTNGNVETFTAPSRPQAIVPTQRRYANTSANTAISVEQPVEAPRSYFNASEQSDPRVAAATTTSQRRGAGGSTTPPWGFPHSSRAGLTTKWVHGGYDYANVVGGNRFNRYSRRGGSSTADLQQDAISAAAATQQSTRLEYDRAVAATTSGSGRVAHSWTPSPSSTVIALGPGGANVARQVPSVAGRTTNSRVSHDRGPHSSGQHGWQRVVVAGNNEFGVDGSGRGRAGEVWEWNGRRVVMLTSPRRRPLVGREQGKNAENVGGKLTRCSREYNCIALQNIITWDGRNLCT